MLEKNNPGKKDFMIFCEGERKTSLKKHIWEKTDYGKTDFGKRYFGKPILQKHILEKTAPILRKPILEKQILKNPILEKKLLEKLILEKPILQKLILENPILKIYLYMYLSIGRELLMPLGGTKLGQSLLSCLMHLVPQHRTKNKRF